MTRPEVYERIDGERSYQNEKWPPDNHDVGSWIALMEDYLHEAKRAVNNDEALDSLRKVVTLGVACFEQHGVPHRNK